MKNRVWAFAIPAVILLAVFLVPSLLTSQSAAMDKPSKEDVAHKMQTIQIPFVANNGQVDKQVKFYATTFGGSVFVTKDGEIVYALPKVVKESETQSSHTDKELASNQHNEAVTLKEEVVNGKFTEITGEGKSVTQVNYFVGNDQSKWKTNIPTYETANLGEVYAGIDLKLKAYGDNVEKLFTVKPDAAPETIRLKLSGAKALKINKDGQLEVRTELGAVKFTRPVAYQEINGKRVEVDCKYVMRDRDPSSVRYSKKTNTENRHAQRTQSTDTDNGHDSRITTYGFAVASYDKSHDLIIDPLLASTYLGGTGGDRGNSLTLDTSGNVYVTGWTHATTPSTGFPTTSGAYHASFNGGSTDVFVSKLNSTLTSLLASTYLGGSGSNYSNGDDYGNSLALDTSGNVYVTGWTGSSDFPTTSGAYDTSFNKSTFFSDVFISKLDSSLTSLLASTYLGGSGSSYDGDQGNSLTLDTSGNVYVTGYTSSTDFPTTSGAYDTSFNGYNDVFVSKLNSGLTTLLASTYLGGSNGDRGNSLTLDTSGNVYVTGYAYPTGFPTTSGAYDTSQNGDGDVFVSKLDSGLTSLLASTYLGGSSLDRGNSLTLDTSGNVYVAGNAYSTDFPTTSGAYDTSYNGGNSDVYVSKLNSGLTSLLASTFLGGSYSDDGYSLTLDTSGNVYVTGNTESTAFPTTSGAYDTSQNGSTDVFVSKLDGGLTSLLASTYLGGSSYDGGNSLALDTSGNVYVTGLTYSTAFPTTSGAYDTSYNGNVNVFVSKLDGGLSAFVADTTPPTVISTSPANGATDVAITSAITATFSEAMDSSSITTSTFIVSTGSSNIGGTVSYSGTTATFTPSSSLSYSTTYTATITTDVKDLSGNAMTSSYTWSFTTGAQPNTTPVADAGADQTPLVNDTVTLNGSGSYDVDGNQLTFSWAFTSVPQGSAASLVNPTSVNPTFTVDKAGSYEVSLMVNDGTVNSAADTVTISTLNSAPVANAGADQTPFVNDTVTLNGSHSYDVDGNQLTYSWVFTTVPQGSNAALSDASVVTPSFTVDKAGTYVVSLIVNDGKVDSQPDTVTISTSNSAPVAKAGPDQTPLVNDTVTLDGSGSYDVDGNQLTFSWAFTTVPQGSAASLVNPTSVNPTFTVDKAGIYVVSLIVNDGNEGTAADTVTISTLNSAPVAKAGPDQTPLVNDTVTLDGSGSYDVDGNQLTYSWAFTTVPQGSAASLVNPTSVNPTFTVDKAGTYVVSLMVNDGNEGTAADTVTISTLNSAPVANAGADQSVYVGNIVTLDGSGSSDADGNALSYNWAFTTKPDGSTATLSDAAAVKPTFTVDKAGTYVISLTVKDGTINSSPDTVTISTINVAPVANAGADQSVNVGVAVTLNGGGSSDADGDTITYSWSFTTKPSGSTAALSGATSANPTFTADKAGTYVVSLIVNDGAVNSSPDTVTITAEDVSEPEVIDASVDIKPETINLGSKGKFKAFIELPSPYKEDSIVTSTVVCEGAHAIDGRIDSSSGGRYVATFNTQDLEVSTNSKREERVFTVTGELMDGTKFEGSDTVKVKGKEKDK